MNLKMLIAVIALGPTLAVAGDMTASCPSALSGEAITVAAPPGWTGASQPVVRLVSAGMTAGPPTMRADIVPYKQKRIRDGLATTWVFDEEEKWFRCSYGSSAVQISKRLDDSARQCTVRHVSAGAPTVTSAVVECTTRKSE